MWKLILMARLRKLMAETRPRIEDIDVIEDKFKIKFKLNGKRYRVKGKYSIIKGDPNKTIDWFHGFMGNEKGFYAPTGSSTSGWVGVYSRLSNPKPTIVSVSIDKSWLISPIEDREKGDKEVTIASMKRVFEFIYDKHSLYPEVRMVAGTSMGGFNALTMAMYTEFYHAVALHVPLAAFPNKIKGIASLLIYGQFKYMEWNKINPLDTLNHLDMKLPPTHIQYSQLDQYGFYEPDKELERILKTRGTDISSVENSGDHADMAPHAMAEFINKVFKAEETTSG